MWETTYPDCAKNLVEDDMFEASLEVDWRLSKIVTMFPGRQSTAITKAS